MGIENTEGRKLSIKEVRSNKNKASRETRVRRIISRYSLLYMVYRVATDHEEGALGNEPT